MAIKMDNQPEPTVWQRRKKKKTGYKEIITSKYTITLSFILNYIKDPDAEKN